MTNSTPLPLPAYAGGKPGSVPAIFNDLYKAKSGVDLDDVSVRGLQGFLVMADALNRAGSTDPAKIRDALKATDLPAPRWMVVVEREYPAPPGVSPLPLPADIPNRHFEYALTWFGLAGALACVYAASLWKWWKD